MIREEITPERVANSIIQDKLHEGVFLIVEGESDFTFFNKFIKKPECEISIAFGNFKVIEAIEILDKRNFSRKLGIIDADFRVLEKEEPINENILITDFHDLEMVIIASPALEVVLGVHCSKE